jgi:predicted CXXCH cytochrome family protein
MTIQRVSSCAAFGFVLVFGVAPSSAGAQSPSAAESNCVGCHKELEDDALTPPATLWEDDIHAASGLTCASCHGGDPTANVDDGDYSRAMDPKKGYIGVPAHRDIPSVCGKCHADATYMHGFDPNLPIDQVAQYATSVHGKRLREGDQKVAECASCHKAHGVLKTKDPRAPVYPTRIPETCGGCHASADYMAGYGIPTTQLEEYRQSVHGHALFVEGDLGAPTCNSCHGNHGAAPPGVDAVSRVCGTCHATQAELFGRSPHADAFAAMELPQCETCHSNHAVHAPTDALVGTAQGAICLDCHGEGEDAFAVAGSIRERIDSLKSSEDDARALVAQVGRAGMEVSTAELDLIDAHQSLVQARNMVHAFALAPVEEKVNEGLAITKKAHEMGEAAVRELGFRRKGLAVSLFFVLVLVLGLYLKIRQIEGDEDARTEGSPR